MKLKNIFFATLATASLSSCGDKMDYKEYAVNDKEYIQETFGRVAGFMTKIYNDLDYDFGNYYGGAVLGAATDEAVYSHDGNNIETFYNGSWSPTKANANIWSTCWDGISYCNLLLDEFSDLTFPNYVNDLEYKQEMHQYENYQWEARWARAYFYFNLLRQYGSVPLKTKHMDADEANALPKASAEEIFKFIDDECVAIKDNIVEDYGNLGVYAYGISETGRANNLAVLALRARAALYHASPLFNPNNDQTLWQKALEANWELIRTCTSSRQMRLASDYSVLFGKDNWSSTEALREVIFGRRVAASRSFETYNFPVGMSGGGAGGGGGNCPTQNLVDAYEMTNGMAINEAGSGYDAQNPYANRDKRLALTVAVNGESWPNVISKPLETYIGGDNGLPNANATPTGYYLKKYVDGATQISGSSASTERHVWVIFRLAEFYLNYAECALNVTNGDGYTAPSGYSMTAAQAINMVRTRAGQPNLATGLSASDFRAKYENERFVELAFEGHRFYDVRRWKKAPQYFVTIRGMEITKNTDGTFNYTPKTIQTRQWDDKMYFFPIAQNEILKSGGAIEQTTGWD